MRVMVPVKATADSERGILDGAGRPLVDGPFAATNELVAGSWLRTVRDMDEAVARARRCPDPMP